MTLLSIALRYNFRNTLGWTNRRKNGVKDGWVMTIIDNFGDQALDGIYLARTLS